MTYVVIYGRGNAAYVEKVIPEVDPVADYLDSIRRGVTIPLGRKVRQRSTIFTDAVDKIIRMDMIYYINPPRNPSLISLVIIVMTPMYPTQPVSPLSSVLAGMGHLADWSRILTNSQTGREQDSEALRDDWRAVGADLRQAIHMYERINKGRRKK
jgi:hypothetical protein